MCQVVGVCVCEGVCVGGEWVGVSAYGCRVSLSVCERVCVCEGEWGVCLLCVCENVCASECVLCVCVCDLAGTGTGLFWN